MKWLSDLWREFWRQLREQNRVTKVRLRNFSNAPLAQRRRRPLKGYQKLKGRK